MATSVWRNYPDSPVFPEIHEFWVLLKGTLLRWKPRNSLTPEYLIFMEHSHAVGVFVCVCEHVGGCKLFPVSLSVSYSVQNNASQQCFLEVTYFGFGSKLLFQRSPVIYCPRRKYSAFIEYTMFMYGYLDICVNVHFWLVRNGFNSSDSFRHRLWWIRLYLFIGINLVACLPSKNFGGIGVTSHVFLSLILV
jgi:hypothetical protein